MTNPAPVDLRSDTVTRPTAAMREAIAGAEVGDDALGDDATTKALERRVAGILGKEAALFFPSGIMANETALLLLGQPGTEAIVEAASHFVDWELGGPAFHGGLQLRTVATPDGLLTAELVEDAIRPPVAHQIRTSLISVENTHNAAGGRVQPLASLRAIRETAGRYGLPVHLDGARLWNAAVATDVPEAVWAACADTVMVTLSKGLGCPVGSLLAGDAAIIGAARTMRRRLGGGMRQTGILAAAGLFALDHHRDRLAQDHERARRLAELAADIDGLRVVPPETNIVMFDVVRPDRDAAEVVEALGSRGVHMVAFHRRRVRAVTHLDIDDDGIDRAATALRQVMSA
jgi:threonine aldolase